MKTSATVAIMELPMLTLKVFIALQLQIERNPPFKMRKKFLVKNSNMQKAETNFLRAMKGYGENEKEKDKNDIFGVLIDTELKKLSKRHKLWSKEKPTTSFMT